MCPGTPAPAAARLRAGALPGPVAERFEAGALPGSAAARFEAGALSGSATVRFEAGAIPGSSAAGFEAGALAGSTTARFGAGALRGRPPRVVDRDRLRFLGIVHVSCNAVYQSRPTLPDGGDGAVGEAARDVAAAAERPAVPAPTMITSTREAISMQTTRSMYTSKESISLVGQGIVLSRPLTSSFSGSTNGRSTISHGWTSPVGSLIRRERPFQSPGSLNLT